MRARRCFISIAAAITTFSALGQPLRLGPVYSSGNDVSVVLEIASRSGLPDRNQVVLIENGVETATASEIQSFRDTGKRMAIVICLDASRSMQRGPIQNATAAIASLAPKYTQHADVAILTFSDRINTLLDFTADPAMIKAAVATVAATGGETAMYAAVSEAMRKLEVRKTVAERRRILLISDGMETDGSRIDDAIKRAQNLGIPIDSAAKGTVASGFAQSMARLADLTGGYFEEARGVGLETALNTVLDLSLQTPVAVFRRTSVAADGPSARAGVKLTFSDGRSETAATNVMIPRTAQKMKLSLWMWLGIALAIIAIVIALMAVLRKKRPVEAPPLPPEPIPEPLPLPPQNPVFVHDPALDVTRLPGDSRRDAVIAEPFVAPVGIPDDRTRISRAMPPAGHLIQLRATAGPEAGRYFNIDKGSWSVGRASDNDLSLFEDYVTGYHARFSLENGRFSVTDLGSTNGTWVNGIRIEEKTELATGDSVRIGSTELRVTANRAVEADGR